MTEESRKQAEKKIFALSFVMLGLLGIFLVVCFVTKKLQSLLFPAGVSLILLLYWAVVNLLPVLWAKCLEGKSAEQKQAYLICTLVDLAGLAGLVYFLVDLESTTGAIVYVVSIFLKKNFREKYEQAPSEESGE